MNNEKICFQPIGVIRSPHKELAKIPIQPVFCKGIEGKLIVNSQYIDGIKELQEFSHIYLFYYFNHSQKTHLQVKPYLSDKKHGIFATRAPHRPNKLGMSLVRLVRIETNIIHIKDIDVLDNTPLLDIKPYIQRFDSRKNAKSGWQDSISDDAADERGIRDFNRKE